jgi:uncharacterized protein (TIGR04255 family)
MARRSRPADLPNFNKPPVTEVAVSVQFDTIAAFSNVYAGLLWAGCRSEYPVASEKPSLSPQFETFGGGGVVSQVPLRFATFFEPPASRFWFEEASGIHLMQIQNDRIVHNWRKRDTNEYPRYEPIADRFEMEIRKFEEFVRGERLGELLPNQCEVTYINTIEVPDQSNPYHQLHRITPICAGQPKMPNQLDPENISAQTRYILKEDDEPFGRVYINFTPVIRSSDLTPAVQLDIIVRARPSAQSIEAAMDLLDREREIVVRTFAAVTTSEMHRLWERTDV